jgi:hypothetical protein
MNHKSTFVLSTNFSLWTAWGWFRESAPVSWMVAGPRMLGAISIRTPCARRTAAVVRLGGEREDRVLRGGHVVLADGVQTPKKS